MTRSKRKPTVPEWDGTPELWMHEDGTVSIQLTKRRSIFWEQWEELFCDGDGWATGGYTRIQRIEAGYIFIARLP